MCTQFALAFQVDKCSDIPKIRVMKSSKFVFFVLCVSNLGTLLSHPIHDNATYLISQPQYVPEAIIKCFSKTNITLCLKRRTIDVLEQAINDNRTWYLGDSLAIEKDINWTSKANVTDYSDLSGALMDKTMQFIESRALRFKLTPTTLEQGRKKDKGFKGGYALLAGAAALALVAQLMMGKIAVIAGAALLFSKLALLLSVVSSLKKGMGGSAKDQVIYSEGSGSGGHNGYSTGWQRSILPPTNEEDYRSTDLHN